MAAGWWQLSSRQGLACWAVSLALIAGCAGSQEASEPVTAGAAASEAVAAAVRTEAVLKPSGRRTLTLLATAKTDEDRVAIVTSPVSGKIRSLLVREGQTVARGQALAEVESQVFAQAELDYVKALSEWRYQERLHEREQALKRQGALSGDELRQTEHALAKAKADLSAAETQLLIYKGTAADVKRLQTTGKVRGTLMLVAPIAGTVLERPVRLGEAVPPERSLMTLVDHGRLWVLARVPEADVHHVREVGKATVRFKAAPERTYEGHVVHLHDAVESATRTVELKLWVANQDGLLRPEMFASVELPVAGALAGAVMPRAALQAAPDGDVAIVAKAEGYELRPVKVVETLDGDRLRVEGVNPGDQVVTVGGQAIKADLIGMPEEED